MANKVEDVNGFLESNNIDIISLTFDGHRSNVSMCNILGASFTLKDLKPYFYTASQKKIHLIFEPCHMLKVIRNQFCAENIIYDENGDEISWFYLQHLEKIQEKEGLRLCQ